MSDQAIEKATKQAMEALDRISKGVALIDHEALRVWWKVEYKIKCTGQCPSDEFIRQCFEYVVGPDWQSKKPGDP